MLYVMYLLMFVHVLIDTWWNVNMIILVVPISASGF